MIRRRFCSILVISLLAEPMAEAADLDTQPASAAGSSKAGRAAQERAARKACLLGDFEKGTETLADLYLDTKDPTHIYNQGRCYEQNGQNAQAILRFREYLRKATNLRASDVEAIETKIRDLQQEDERRKSAAQNTAIPASAPVSALKTSSPPEASTSVPEALNVTQTVPADDREEAKPIYKRWWFWGGIGAVVAGGVVTAVVLSSRSGAQSPACANTGVVCVP